MCAFKCVYTLTRFAPMRGYNKTLLMQRSSDLRLQKERLRVHELEDVFGVSAAAPVAVAAAPAAGGAAEEAEEKTNFDVILEASATTRSASSRLSVLLPTLASRRQRRSSRVLLRQSSRALRRRTLRLLRLSSRRLALPSPLSKSYPTLLTGEVRLRSGLFFVCLARNPCARGAWS